MRLSIPAEIVQIGAEIGLEIEKFPIILVGTDYWKGLIKWIKEVLLNQYQAISPEDMDLIHLVDTPEEVTAILDAFYKQYQLSPNF